MFKLNYYIPPKHQNVSKDSLVGNGKITIVQGDSTESFRVNDFNNKEISIETLDKEEFTDELKDSFEEKVTKLTEKNRNGRCWYANERFVPGTSKVYINGVRYWIDDDDYRESSDDNTIEGNNGIILNYDTDDTTDSPNAIFEDDDEVVVFALLKN